MYCKFCKDLTYRNDVLLSYKLECRKNVEKKVFADKSQILREFLCLNCRKKGGVEERTSITKFPEKLIILIRRFDNHLNKKATYINNFLLGSDRYRLVAIISHVGQSIGSGHYKTFEVIDENEMICFDDHIIEKISTRYEEGYILGFERKK